MTPLVLAALATAAVQTAPVAPRALAAAPGVDAKRLAADIERLAAFGTRHTLSDTQSPKRGIGAARRWARARLESLAPRCAGGLEVFTAEQTFQGDRIPKPTPVQDVLALKRGVSDPDRVVIISAHIDSRNSDPLDAVGDAPGANDDGSGLAVVLEAARLLCDRPLAASVVFAVLSGEEQGLYGGRILADTAKARGWRVEAQLNNDIVGNTHGDDGRVVDSRVRVFSEGVRADETPAEGKARRLGGGESDSPSRNLARFIAAVAERDPGGLSAMLVQRADRHGRGGDQAPMQAAGYPAVRITEADENYHRQHQNPRTVQAVAYGDVVSGVDIPYLAKVARLNIRALTALASAPPPPSGVEISGAVTPDTTLAWRAAPGAVDYRVWWRDTMDPRWRTETSRLTGGAAQITLSGVNIDDYSFGVSAIAADGSESPVEFPGPVGAFQREAPAKP